MSTAHLQAAHTIAVDVYGDFLRLCVDKYVINDRVGHPSSKSGRIDGRPVRLLTISGKGGWSSDKDMARKWQGHNNISLLDHLLSVARGAIMFWLVDNAGSAGTDFEDAHIRRMSYAVISIAFMHDIDKDLDLRRGEAISVEAINERMTRYGIHDFLKKQMISISPKAMRNYIESVEGTQAGRSKAAKDYDRLIDGVCKYVELADKLDGAFHDNSEGGGTAGVVSLLQRWTGLSSSLLTDWECIEIHDHVHPFLLDRFARALSKACLKVAKHLPLIETVHDGKLLCLIPAQFAPEIKEDAIKQFLARLPYKLRVTVNNRLSVNFRGGAVSWSGCRSVLDPSIEWEPDYAKLFALPRSFALEHRQEIEDLFGQARVETNWIGLGPTDKGATVKPISDPNCDDNFKLGQTGPLHAVMFLVAVLNHSEPKGAEWARECALLALLQRAGRSSPAFFGAVPASEPRARRILLAAWAIAEVWQLAENAPGDAQKLLDSIIGKAGLVGEWIDGTEGKPGIAQQITDTASEMRDALKGHFESCLMQRYRVAHDGVGAPKRCIICNESVHSTRNISSASRAHGVKVSAFSGRDGRNDHLTSPKRDTHLCLPCLAEVQLRHEAQGRFRGGGDLPPLVSSPPTVGLFGGLALEQDQGDRALGLYDLNRLEIKPGSSVYRGLDCQFKRIRIARLKRLPVKERELASFLRLVLTAVQRTGRPVHIFSGSPRQDPGVFHCDSLPPWMVRLVGGSTLRLEQIENGLLQLQLFEEIAGLHGVGLRWAKQLADLDPRYRLGALCVALSAVQKREIARNHHQHSMQEARLRAAALDLLKQLNGGKSMRIKENDDPLIRLAWLATQIQRRHSSRDSTNKQLLCWKIAMDALARAKQSNTDNPRARVFGLAGMLETELVRKKEAAARVHRGDKPLSQACLDFAEHFVFKVCVEVFNAKPPENHCDPASSQRQWASHVYRFALNEAFKERGISESPSTDVTSYIA